GSLSGEQDGGAAFGDLADALERLGARAEQRAELWGELCLPERFTGHGEDLAQGVGWQERREDEVDEAAFIALAAPVVQSATAVTVKSLIATTERTVVFLQLREFAPYPELRPIAQPREILRHGLRDLRQ